MGAAEEDLGSCGGVEGLLTGPQAGDLGDWHATATALGRGGGSGGSGGSDRSSRRTAPAEPEECPDGEERCGEECVDLQTNRDHCGACGQVCPDMGGLVCADGEYGCPSGWTDCSQAPDATEGIDSYCADLDSDPAYCGSCGNACDSGVCTDGECSEPNGCEDGEQRCGNRCRDLTSDDVHCDACDNACEPLYELCIDGVCVEIDCGDGLTNCNGVCADLRTDPFVYGDCANASGEGQGCEGGTCVDVDCPDGQTICRGTCVDLQADPANCGQSGVGCVSGICAGGECTDGSDCGQDLVACDGACIDPTSSPNNSGGCGIACRQDQICFGGGCACPEGTAECEGSGLGCPHCFYLIGPCVCEPDPTGCPVPCAPGLTLCAGAGGCNCCEANQTCSEGPWV